jgi:2-polyprenyl-3-methyl-5-hydroxy-6-metoxy-1,4-benzoquinol methylase
MIMDDIIFQKKIYETLPPELYYNAITNGNKIQQFWQNQKFQSVLNETQLNGKDTLIDIGCGPGVLLSHFFSKGLVPIGIDISKNQVQFTNNLLKNNQNIVGACQALPIKKNSLDYVFLVEVIEHLYSEDAEITLNSIFNILNEKGALIMTTPNYHSFWPIIEFFWTKLNPIKYDEQHINKQNIKKIRKSLLNVGFKNIKIKTIFIFSPFLALFSENVAKKFMKLEKSLFSNFGSLIIIKAEK